MPVMEGREALLAALDASDAGTYVIDVSGSRPPHLSEGTLRLFGFARGEQPDVHGFLGRIHPDDRSAVAEAVAETVRTGRGHAIEYRVAPPGGEERWIAGRAELLGGAGDGPGLLVGTVADVTTRRRAERTAHEALQFTRRVLDNLFAFVGVLTVDGVLEEANRAPLAAAGLTHADVLGRYFWECAWFDHDPAVQEDLRRAVQRAAAGEVVRYDVPIRTVGDGRMWIDFQLAPLRDDHGRVTHLVPSAIDIEARRAAELRVRESEERLRQVFSSIDQGFCLCEMVLDDDGHPVDYRFLEVNPQFAPMTGIDAAVGITARQAVPGLEQSWVDTYAAVAFGDTPLRFQAGSDVMGRFFDVFAVPVEPRGRFALVFTDLTEQRRADEILRVTAANDAYRVALSDALRAAATPHDAVQGAVALLADHLGVDRAMWADSAGAPDGGGFPAFTVTADHARPGVPPVHRAGIPLSAFGPAVVDALAAGHTLAVADVGALGLPERTAAAFEAAGVAAHVSVPLVRDGALVALLAVHQASPRAWTPVQVSLVEETAERAWAAVARLRAQAAERRARTRAELLAEVVGQLEAVRGFAARARRLVDLLVPDVATGAVLELRSGAESLRVDTGSLDGDAVVVPVEAGTTHGVLWLAGAGLHGEQAFLDEIGTRTGLLLENARLLEQEHEIALRLQRALLPERLVEQEGVEIGARYAAGSDGLEVGGDWYDTYALADGRLVLTVGDVVGHGLDAAAAMGRLRTGVATLVQRAAGPAELLVQLDELVAAGTGPRFATACVAYLDPATGVLTYAHAGHLPGLVVAVDGSTRWLEGGRTPPLTGDALPRHQASVVLDPGDVVLLYSDGLVERRGEVIDTGLERLEVAARELTGAGADPDALCAGLVERLVSRAPGGDDVVVLCLRLCTADPLLHLVLPVDRSTLPRVRTAVRRWLAQRRVAGDQALDALLAVGEAVANAVEHGLPDGERGVVEVTLMDRSAPGRRRIDVEVRDTGSWRSGVSDGDRGRGTGIMQSLARAFERTTGPIGTTVTFTLAWHREERPD